MNTFPIDLMTLIGHIHTQYEKVMHNRSFSLRMCHCRTQIFEQFTVSVEKLLIKLGARTLKFTEDYRLDLSSDITELSKWFKTEVYDHMYNSSKISNKMVLTFQMMQEYQDKKFFDLIQLKYENILRHLKENDADPTKQSQGVEAELNELFEEIRAWFELFIYQILSTQFNCQSIKSQFLIDHNIPLDAISELHSKDTLCCGCIHHNECNKCKIHESVMTTGETINIIIVNEFIKDMQWLDKLIYIVSNYHIAPDNITLCLDYRMYDQLVQCRLSHEHYDKILEASSCFKHIKIKNYEGINFNGYYDKVKHLLD